MSCCGKRRKQASDASKPTLASPVGLLSRRPRQEGGLGREWHGDAGRDGPVTPQR